MTKPVDLDALSDLLLHMPLADCVEAVFDAYPAMAAELRERRVREEAMAAELRALREVAEAARNLTNWDWLFMLNDNESPNTDHVRADVRKLAAALAKVPR